MRVITEGLNRLDIPKQATCANCRAVIEFTAREVRRVRDARDGDYFTFPCPCCAADVTKATK